MHFLSPYSKAIMFINEEDYRVVIGAEALNIVSKASCETRYNAESEAIEEISSYLRAKYDCNAIFLAEGEMRNKQIVMYAVDMALYHMASSLPQRMGMEIRKERYDRAIKWLEGVWAGRITPDLPVIPEEYGIDTCNTVFSSNKRLRHDW